MCKFMMKKTTLIAIALTLSLCVTVFMSKAIADTESHCNQIERLAEVIMIARQKGIPASHLMTALKDDKTAVDLMVQAYKVGIRNSEDEKQYAITEFKNKYYLLCLEVNKE